MRFGLGGGDMRLKVDAPLRADGVDIEPGTYDVSVDEPSSTIVICRGGEEVLRAEALSRPGSASAIRRTPILGARVEHLGAKEALIASDPGIFFTTPHFDGYPAILVRLDRISVEDLEEVVAEGWLARAPRRLVKAYLETWV